MVALRAYEPDTVVIEVDEEPPMHVRGDDGYWHRRAVGQLSTACGQHIELGAQIRHETYAGRLCPLCFTPFELAAGERVNANARPDGG